MCKAFFLTTLGFGQTSADAVVAAVEDDAICAQADTDRRGEAPAINKLDIEALKEHVWKFHPIKHHYRYEHAPNRYYLPQDLTIAQMHHDYLAQENAQKCSFETYRKVVRSFNISFTRLAGEECSRCSSQVQHAAEAHGKIEEEPRHHEPGCEVCEAHTRHIDAATEALTEEHWRAYRVLKSTVSDRPATPEDTSQRGHEGTSKCDMGQSRTSHAPS